MNILDNPAAQQKLDRSNLYDSVVELSKQGPHAWQAVQALKIPSNYRQVDNLVMSGMGGSGLAARVIQSCFFDQLKLPLTRVNNYHLPAWVNEKTLVICSSYSGTTEETVQTAREAIKQKAKLLAICTGGTLEKLVQQANLPYYKIDPQFNPSQQPRMAIGYSIIGQLALVSRCGLIKFSQDELKQLTQAMTQVSQNLTRNVSTKQNLAKTIAQTLEAKQIIFVAADHLTGALHVVKNQMNENAKHLAHRHDIPELNHHLLEGLRFPQSNKNNTVFFFVNSKLYPQRIQQRFKITQAVVAKNHLQSVSLDLQASTKLAQVFELIQIGGFINFYLTMLHGLDPTPIPWVDYLKTELGQPLGK